MINIPTTTEIQKYLQKHQRGEESSIDDKSKDRVTRALAESVKKTKPLEGGRCNLCSVETDRLSPVTMELCIACCNKLIKRGEGLKVINKEFKDYHCDYCLSRTFNSFLVNPMICRRCAIRIGHTHKLGKQEMHQQIKKEKIEKQKAGIYAEE